MTHRRSLPPQHHSATVALCLTIVTVAFACGPTSGECETDTDCGFGQVCQSAGGILFGESVCVRETTTVALDGGTSGADASDGGSTPDTPPERDLPNCAEFTARTACEQQGMPCKSLDVTDPCGNTRSIDCREFIDFSSSNDHCGGCDNACDFAHSTAVCEKGQCKITSCESNWGNANGQLNDGCECKQSGADEMCNGMDDDCDGRVDESCPCNFKGKAAGVCGDAKIDESGDCDRPSMYQSAETAEDGRDNDCDGVVDNVPFHLRVATSSDDLALDVVFDSSTRQVFVGGLTQHTLGGVSGPVGLVLRHRPATGNQNVFGMGSERVTGVGGLSIYSGGDLAVAGIQPKMNNPGVSPVLLRTDRSLTQSWKASSSSVGLHSAVAVGGANNRAHTIGLEKPSSELSLNLAVTSYDSSGMEQWKKTYGFGPLSGMGNLRLGGIDIAGSALYAFSSTNESIRGKSPVGQRDAVLIRYTSSGSESWVRMIGSSGEDRGTAVAIDPQRGDVYVAGWTIGALKGQTSSGGRDIFIAKFDGAGTRQWLKQIGSPKDDRAQDIVFDSHNDQVVLVGGTDGNLLSNTSNGGEDAFVARFDRDGNTVGSRLLGSGRDDTANAAAVDPKTGDIFVAGWSEGDFDGQTNRGGKDAYVLLLKRP